MLEIAPSRLVYVWHGLASQYEKATNSTRSWANFIFSYFSGDISWNMLNTKEVAGIPQNRVRLFIAGTLRVAKKNEFVWPPQAARFLQPKSQCGAVFSE